MQSLCFPPKISGMQEVHLWYGCFNLALAHAASRVGIPRLSSISSQGFQDLRSRNGSPSRASSPSRDPAKAAPRFKSPREPLAEIQSPASSRTATAPQAWSIVKAKEHTEAKSAAVKDFCQEAAPPCTLEHYPHGYADLMLTLSESCLTKTLSMRDLTMHAAMTFSIIRASTSDKSSASNGRKRQSLRNQS